MMGRERLVSMVCCVVSYLALRHLKRNTLNLGPFSDIAAFLEVQPQSGLSTLTKNLHWAHAHPHVQN